MFIRWFYEYLYYYSDHIIMLKTKFHYNTQHIDQVKPKYEGGASAPKAPPLDPPLHSIKLWNTLPEDVVNQPSINCFKDVLLNHLNLL